MTATLALFALCGRFGQDSPWPKEAPLPDVGAVDAAAESDAETDPGRHYFAEDLSITLRDGKRATNGLSALWGAFPPAMAFHSLEAEKKLLGHKSKTSVLLSSRRDYIMRTFATPEGALSLVMWVYPTILDAEHEMDQSISGDGGSVRPSWQASALGLGHQSWVANPDHRTSYVRDGRIVVRVIGKSPLGLDQVDFHKSIHQSIRFRLMVASGLLPGGNLTTRTTSAGLTLTVRVMDGVPLVSLSELAKAGVAVAPSSSGRLRTCQLVKNQRALKVTEYQQKYLVGTETKDLPLAPFAYDGDLWLPYEPVAMELAI
jgi:hypothetical protein